MYIQNNTGKISGMINGEVKEEIPNTRYMEIGDTKYISVQEGIEYTLNIQGNETEMIMLDIDKEMNGNTIETKTLESLPTKNARVNISSTFGLTNTSFEGSN